MKKTFTFLLLFVLSLTMYSQVDLTVTLSNLGGDPPGWNNAELSIYEDGVVVATFSTNGVHTVNVNYNAVISGGYTPTGEVQIVNDYSITGGGIDFNYFQNHQTPLLRSGLPHGAKAIATVEDEPEPLPISLIYFEAVEMDENINSLRWATSSEINNDYFTLSFSCDLENWTTVKNMRGAGNSTVTNTYVVTHKTPVQGCYYRLTQTDFDGTTEIFPYVAVSRSQFTRQRYIIFDTLGRQLQYTSDWKDIPINTLYKNPLDGKKYMKLRD